MEAGINAPLLGFDSERLRTCSSQTVSGPVRFDGMSSQGAGHVLLRLHAGFGKRL